MGYYDDPDSEQRAQDWDDTLNTVNDYFDDYSQDMADDIDDASHDLINEYKKHDIKGMKGSLKDIDNSEHDDNDDLTDDLEDESYNVDLDDVNQDENGSLMKADSFNNVEDDIKDDLEEPKDKESQKDLKEQMGILEDAHKEYRKHGTVGLYVGDANEEGDSFDGDKFSKKEIEKQIKRNKPEHKLSHSKSKFKGFQTTHNQQDSTKQVKSLGQKHNPKVAKLLSKKQGRNLQ